ncbi:M3 family oligoendopeptidase [Apilactobacillus apinorum]|uniref:M3 family oligoendopeptidase n=1 Tax=Apilactobacillus apinorum TaxID=1218495 RepID=UPI0006B49FFF|nr:M3 family oligoendopeptidase [Apilactobacillus apinorum]KOY68322.1 Oligoendopeptidase F [Apilactobacillus apinorum]CAI2689689.1 Oligoendopeptidase F [Apilactobacillus apinorum]
MKYSLNWDLDSIFPGGLHGKALTEKIQVIGESINTFRDAINDYHFTDDDEHFTRFTELTDFIQKIQAGIVQTGMYISGKHSEDVNNEEVTPLIDKIQSLDVKAAQISQLLQKKLASLSDDAFEKLITEPSLHKIIFSLNEQRHFGQELLDDNEEAIIAEMNLEGLSAWSNHYSTLVSSVQVDFKDNEGNPKTLSAGQADNEILGNADPKYRAELMPKWEEAWGDKQNLFADTLNHVSGSRLLDYRFHGTDDFLKYPLELNRMSQKTLDTMWKVVDANKDVLIDFLNRKAQLIGKEQIGWEDVAAPLNIGDGEVKTFTYDEAAEFIIKQFNSFSPKMAQLAQRAFENQWIEAENRPGKEPGGYMESLPETGESRIFLTFTGSPNDASTIAHELGHAFHSSVMNELPYFRQDYAMNVAETASTFSELIVSDANVKEAQTDEEKINLLNAKMDNPVAMFLNIHARFIFEKKFYEKRKDGVLTASEINDLMLDAQKEAYDNSLSTYSTHFWESKMHFYFDDVPFYNFPYTFGYLFSLGIYAKAQESDNFEDQYIALLQDTANMSTEELAMKHLGVDLTKPDFWEDGVKLIQKDVDEFIRLTEKYV